MQGPIQSRVLVCVACKDKGEPSAPRSCIQCRRAMCEHVWFPTCLQHAICQATSEVFRLTIPVQKALPRPCLGIGCRRGRL